MLAALKPEALHLIERPESSDSGALEKRYETALQAVELIDSQLRYGNHCRATCPAVWWRTIDGEILHDVVDVINAFVAGTLVMPTEA